MILTWSMVCPPTIAAITQWIVTAVPVASGSNATTTNYWATGDPNQVGLMQCWSNDDLEQCSTEPDIVPEPNGSKPFVPARCSARWTFRLKSSAAPSTACTP